MVIRIRMSKFDDLSTKAYHVGKLFIQGVSSNTQHSFEIRSTRKLLRNLCVLSILFLKD